MEAMMTRKDGVQQMGVRTAILALFIGFFLIITKVSTQGAICLESQVAGVFPTSGSLVVNTTSKAVSVAEYDFQLNFPQVFVGYNS
jgi:hypothetical protein